MKLLTLARDLKRRKARERQGLFVVEGVRAIEELLRSPLAVHGALVSPHLEAAPRGALLRAALAALAARGIPIAEVTDAEFATAADTETPQGVLAVAAIPSRRLDELSNGPRARLLVLDAVQDPGNVGTILRTAAALGAAATVALPGTVDLWNAKVVRSAMGAHFHHPALSCTWEELDPFLGERGIVVWAAAAGGAPLDPGAAPDRLALVVGNEGAGLSDATRQRARHTVALPLAPSIESLNVAVAAGIFLYELSR